MSQWLYEIEIIRQNPSVQAGMDFEQETKNRREAARFMFDLGSSLKLPLTTIATGIVYFHRYYMAHSFQEFYLFPTALVCLFLAGKVEDTPKKCKDLINAAKTILPPVRFTRQFGDDGNRSLFDAVTLERILLQTIKFNLQVEHPYRFLVKYARSLKGDKERLERMVQMAWNFVNDSFCSTLCLQWEPEILAIAAMHLAGKLCKFNFLDWEGRNEEHVVWWDMFVTDMTLEYLENICHKLLDLYAQPRSQSRNLTPMALTPTKQAMSPTPIIPLSPVKPFSPVKTPTTSSLYKGYYPEYQHRGNDNVDSRHFIDYQEGKYLTSSYESGSYKRKYRSDYPSSGSKDYQGHKR